MSGSDPPAPRGVSPTAGVVAAALLLGAWGLSGVGADPLTLAPASGFTAGHLLAIALGRAHLAAGHPFATSTTLLGWPDVAGFRPLLWPVQVLGWALPPTVAYTLACALIPAANALGGAWLARRLGADRWGSAAAGAALAFHPWVRETLTNGQLEQAGLGGIAALWAIALAAAGGSRGARIGVGPVAAALAFAAPHLGLAGAAGLGLLAVGGLVRERGSGAARWAEILALAGAGVALAGSYHAGNFATHTQVFWPKGSPGHAGSLSDLPEVATVRALLLPPAGFDAATGTLHPMYLGLGLLGAALVGARRTRWSPLLVLLPLAGLLLLAFGEHLGPLPGPYRLLTLLSASLRQSQSPYRMVAGVVVLLAVLAGGAVRGRGGLVALTVLLWGETLAVGTRPWPLAVASFPRDPVVAPFQRGSGALLDLPLVGPKCPGVAYHYALEAARRGRPSPVLPAAPAIYPTVPGLMQRVLKAWQARPCGPALAALVRDAGFTGVVLHRHDPTCPVQPSFERCLTDAFGPGEEAPGLRWWDPLPSAGAPPRAPP